MGRKAQNQSFICKHCREYVVALTNGSYRNHCPFCFYSVHVDKKPGDRAETCCGLMKPIGVTLSSKKGLQVIHQCLKCNIRKVNKIAEDTEQPDNFDEIIQMLKSSEI